MRRGALKAWCLSIVAVIVLSSPSFAQQPRLLVIEESSNTASGLAGGAQGGYNWQNGPAVYGFEADISATDLNDAMRGGFRCLTRPCSFYAPTLSASASSSVGWYGTVRGRLGWAAGPILFYGTGGFAYGKVDLASTFSVVALSSSVQSTSTRTGWVAGGGIEYMLQQNVMLSLGYQYVDLGTLSLAAGPQSTSCCASFLTQSASAHAQFQVVTLGLSWRFAAADAAGTSNPWQGGYFGGHVGGAWGYKSNATNAAFGFTSCFTAATQVLMADGTSRPIAAVKIGDQVLGENGEVNRVVEIETPALGSRKLYAFNDGPAFVTPEHPFMTRAGWKSMAPDATFAENNNLSVGALQLGDELVKLETVTTRARPMSVAFGGTAQAPPVEVLVETGFSPLESTKAHDGDPSMIVYNLRLDGNHTYFANDYLVHNK
jgi:outer membrane immunogenic protein